MNERESNRRTAGAVMDATLASILILLVVMAAVATGVRAGGIAGTIRDAQTLLPLAGIDLDVFDANFVFISTVNATTLADGSYLLSPLAAGNYYLRADPTCAQGYVDQYYNGVFLKSQAVTVAVAQFGTTIINMNLQRGGTISGHILAASGGAPLDSIDLDVYDLNRDFITSVDARSGIDGSYVLGRFPLGTYYVKADPTDSSMFVQMYYNGRYVRSLADPVVVTGTGDVPNIDFHLLSGGIIHGRITSAATGLPIQGIDLDIYDTLGVYVSYAHDTTTTAGYYTVGSIPPGYYYVKAAPDPTQYYVHTYYGGSRYRSGATKVSVSAGYATNFIDIALPPGGTMSGRVTNAGTGGGLPDLHLTIFDSLGDIIHYGAGHHTIADGTFLFGALPAGTYFVRCDGSVPLGLAFRYYDGIVLRSQATPITITPGVDRPNVNIALQAGGWITGTIRDGGQPVPNIDLDVYASNQEAVGALNDSSDAAGVYLLGPIPPGGYYVRADPTDTTKYSEQFFNHVPTIATATLITVAANQTQSMINFDLCLAGIPGGWERSGTLLQCFPNPSRGQVAISYSVARPGLADLAVYDAQGRRIRGLASCVQAAGGYSLTWDGRSDDGRPVPPGVYFVQVKAGATVSQKVVLLE